MILRPPKYRASLFRRVERDRDRTDAYFRGDKLDDPRSVRINEIETAFVRSRIDRLPPGATLVDVPCGNGRMTQWACDRGDLRVLALDLNRSMLESLQVQGSEALLRCRVQAEVTRLPLADRSVDLLLNMRLMHHIPDHETRVAMYRELSRVTRGEIVTSFWTTRSWRYIRRRIRGKEIRCFPMSPQEYRTVCEEAGLRIDELRPVRHWYEEQCVVLCRPREQCPS